MLIYDNDILERLRGDKYGLGGLKWHEELHFNEHIVSFTSKSRIYLYTDGIIDQPLAVRDKLMRLGHPAFLELLSSWAHYNMQEQCGFINERIDTMLEYHEQRDDITIVGIRIG